MKKLLAALSVLFVLSSNAMAFPHGAMGVAVPTDNLQRAPVVRDDINKGYNVGDYWYYNGNVWINTANTAGAATWTLQTVSSTFLGTVTTASPKACYGTDKLVSGYSGNSMEITRASDSTTLAVGFTSNYANFSAIDTFCAGTTCGVDKLYDQCGSGYDLVQATAANMPQIFTNAIVGGKRAITFGDVFNQASYENRYMINTALPITNRQNFTTLLISRPFDAGGPGSAIYDLGSPTPVETLFAESGTTAMVTKLKGSVVSTLNTLFLTNNSLMLAEMNGDNGTLIQNNKITTGNAATASSAATGIEFGSTSLVYYPGKFQMTDFIVYDSSLSSADQTLLLSAAYTLSAVQPQAYDNFTTLGDSITCCTGPATPTQLATQLTQAGILTAFSYMSNGFPGQSAALYASHTEIATSTYIPRKNNVAIVDLGTNDLAVLNNTESATFAAVQSICSNMLATGFNKCLVTTTRPRDGLFSNGATGAGFETARLQLNIDERNYFVNIIDIGGDPNMGQLSDLTGPYYCNDLVHPCTAGALYESNFYIPIFQNFLQ